MKWGTGQYIGAAEVMFILYHTVQLTLSTAEMLAPLFNNKVTESTFPFLQASNSGVIPFYGTDTTQ